MKPRRTALLVEMSVSSLFPRSSEGKKQSGKIPRLLKKVFYTKHLFVLMWKKYTRNRLSSQFYFSSTITCSVSDSISNIRKVYKDKENTVEALSALLGHSGAGKSTLMNILCGICPPTNGSATIYGSPVAEIAEGSEMKQLVGICPQFNIIFDVLTVEEHLRIFAAIKGIPPADINAEVPG
ncbi:hypothetical protein XENOCAPTIV_014896 [Xenoophorus captivus]|uniref:ABC transporter domain-containing protein n=1 Tax=Xenoophorus captivus TaxID=1517983 RepID=A0ABV0RU93_9TELE